MRLLLGPDAPRPIAEEALGPLYAWPEGRWVRAMMLQTLDGSAIGPDGRSKSISSAADMQVFRQGRRGADAILIGAGTMRAERYRPMTAEGAGRLVVVSASLDLPWDEPVWSESAQRPLVLTQEGADGGALATARLHAEVDVLASASAEAIIGAIERRGLRRITCEGGPRLLAALVTAGLVDELDISIAPLMVGGGQIDTGMPQGPAAYSLVHVLEEAGYLFTRLVRGPEGAPTIAG